eukprot:4684241-Prymnesium_polylepis.1
MSANRDPPIAHWFPGCTRQLASVHRVRLTAPLETRTAPPMEMSSKNNAMLDFDSCKSPEHYQCNPSRSAMCGRCAGGSARASACRRRSP